MKNFIPLNNNIDKLIAFTPSLDKNYRNHQKILSKPYQIETLDVIENLQDKGWKIKGSYQNQSKKSKRISSHVIKLEHPDFPLTKHNGAPEAIANLIISNSCNGSSPLELNLGAYRRVCSNGLIARDAMQSQKIKHNSNDYYQLNQILSDLNIKTQEVLAEFSSLKDKTLTAAQMEKFAKRASQIRFGKKSNEIDPLQLLNVVRDEDKGDNLWKVYNRVQENLTQPNRIKTQTNKLISGIFDPKEDIRVNRQLSNLVHDYV